MLNSRINKMDALLYLVCGACFDIVAVEKTLSSSAIPSSFLLLLGFEIVLGYTGGAVHKLGVCRFVGGELNLVEVDFQCPKVVLIHFVYFECTGFSSRAFFLQ